MAKDPMERLPFRPKAYENYLIKQGNGHHNLKYYSTESAIVSIVRDGRLYLGNGYDWNDRFDVERFNSDQYDYVQFGKCLSVSRSESVAMWQIYAGNKDGCMLDFGTQLRELIRDLDKIEIAIYDKEKDEYICIRELKKGQFQIQLKDVLYIEDNRDDTYTIKRADCRIEKAPRKLVDAIIDSCKNMCWSYENECRLIVKVPRSVIGTGNYNSVIIQIPDKIRNVLVGKVYGSPLYPEQKLSIATTRSSLEGNIDFKDKE